MPELFYQDFAGVVLAQMPISRCNGRDVRCLFEGPRPDRWL